MGRGQFKMGGANLCCSSFRFSGSVTLLGIFITWRPPKKLSVIEIMKVLALMLILFYDRNETIDVGIILNFI